jgi:large subunit ribosomal protein L5
MAADPAKKEPKEGKDPRQGKEPKGGKGGGESKAPKEPKEAKEAAEPKAPKGPKEPVPTPRLVTRYKSEVVPALMKQFKLKNVNQVPRLKKVVLNMGVGKAIDNKKRLEEAVAHLAAISGQKPVITKAKTSVAGFRLREGMPIGCKVDLRDARMWEFLDRLISLAIPRIRDFRGIKANSFDGRGNFSLGLAEESVFPEVNMDKAEFSQGLDVTVVISGGNDQMSSELLTALGMPFKKN